jgi:hypothetical protein
MFATLFFANVAILFGFFIKKSVEFSKRFFIFAIAKKCWQHQRQTVAAVCG